jgi:hypothetical protein
MSHDYHVGREGAVLFDNCGECDARAANPIEALLNLDSTNYAVLRDRMLAVEFGDDADSYRSSNEARVGKALYAFAVLEERHGGIRRFT